MDMRVTVKLFATLTHYKTGARSGRPFAVDLPENAMVKDLMDLLQIPAEETKVVFINNIIRETDAALSDGDVVGMFPPVGGG
jgi:molybdopterin converting factor small subunit